MSFEFYNNDPFSALDAISTAQKIAFAPMVFQAAISLRDLNILSYLDNSKNGRTLEEIISHTNLSEYSASVLLDMGLSAQILYKKDDLFHLTKVGYFLIHDEMTRVNMNFMQDICYQSMFFLTEALKTNEPAGLKTLGEDWKTIYPHLSSLPEPKKTSWFEYDHFYSDSAFQSALDSVLSFEPEHIYDIGGNTGKFALACCKKSNDVQITIIDLPEQVVTAKENIEKNNLTDRIHTYPANILETTKLPTEADIWWMSQFLDCFSKEQIIHILKIIKTHKKPSAKICILDVFWNNQPFEAAAFTINASSLYFTAVANGKSRFYHLDVFKSYIEEAGLQITEIRENIGISHTLIVCQ